MTLAQVGRLQRRLAYVAPATAVAVNMHLYWTGVAAELYRAGDTSLAWLLEEAADGHVFAAGHGEAGNDVPLFLSTTSAERAEGGWSFTGHKIFGSLSPVWTYLGLHAMDTSDPAGPRIVHAFLGRDAEGYRIEETWDTLGMRATASNDTILDGAFVPDERVALVCPAGIAGARPFQVAIFAWGLLGFADVYTGIARRGLRPHRRARPPAHVARAHAIDGLSPGGAAPRRRDADDARVDRRATRPDARRVVDRCRPRPRLAGQDRDREVRRRSRGLAHRRHRSRAHGRRRASSSATAWSSSSATRAWG